MPSLIVVTGFLIGLLIGIVMQFVYPESSSVWEVQLRQVLVRLIGFTGYNTNKESLYSLFMVVPFALGFVGAIVGYMVHLLVLFIHMLRASK